MNAPANYAFDPARLAACCRDSAKFFGRNPLPVAVVSTGPDRRFNWFRAYRRPTIRHAAL